MLQSSLVVRRSRTISAVFAAAWVLGAGCGDNAPTTGLGPHGGAGGSGGGNDAAPDAAAPDAGSPDAAPAPACDLAWHDLQIGTELDDQAWGLATDRDLNLYVAGFEHGVTGVTNIEPDGDSRGVVIKLDPTGTQQWKAVLDTAATDTVEGVAIEAATGTVYAVGRTSGAFDGFVNQGQFDAFLAAVDPHGQATRVLQVGDERPQHPTRLDLGADRRIAVAGYDDTFVEGNAVEALEDGFVASFQRGATLHDGFTEDFLQKVPTTAQNRATDVVLDRDGSGSMYVTSMVTSGRTGFGVFVKKLSRDGTTLWSTRISNITADAANAVALSPSNELFVTGATFQTLGPRSFGQQDAYVLKVDKATGSILWAAQAGSRDSDYPTAMAFDGAGNIYIAGHTFFADPDDPTLGNLDPFAMKFDPTGALLSTWRGGTEQDEFVTSMAVDGCGHAYVGGYTKGSMVKGGAGNAGGWDMFVVRPAF
jgi:hypothetical protein